MKKVTVILSSYTPITSEEGVMGYSTSAIEEVKGVILPITAEMAQKDSGYHNNTSFKFYTKSKSNSILEGNVITYNDKNYMIVSVGNYGKMQELTLNTIVGKNSVRRIVKSFYY